MYALLYPILFGSLLLTITTFHLKDLKKYLPLLLLGCILPFFSCKKKAPDTGDVILSIKQTGQLVTAEYVVSKIIKASDDATWYKFGNRKILMSCEAHLKAGIDFQTITPQNFSFSDSLVTVTLPRATFFTLNIPPDKIQLQYEEIGFLRDSFSAAEREKLLAQAEQQIRQLAASMGILKTAQENAALYVQTLLRQSGFKSVAVNFQ